MQERLICPKGLKEFLNAGGFYDNFVETASSEASESASLPRTPHGFGGYRYRYADSDLQTLCSLCAGREGYVMFNNMTMKGDALSFLAPMEHEEKLF